MCRSRPAVIDVLVSGVADLAWCNGTFDGELCWEAAPANTTSLKPCPSWLHGFDKSSTFAIITSIISISIIIVVVVVVIIIILIR